MRRVGVLLAAALLASAAAGVVAFRVRSHPYRQIQCHADPDLAWLAREFSIAPEAAARVAELHAAYTARCEERCAAIRGQDERLRGLMEGAGHVTPEIEELVRATEATRRECRLDLLAHAFEVSRHMAPEQARRYLAWMQGRMDRMTAPEPAGPHGH